MKPAPPVTRTVSMDQLGFQRPLRQHRQHRLHTPLWASEWAPSGLNTLTVLTMLTMPSQQPCRVDDADGGHPPPFTRYPSFCSSSPIHSDSPEAARRRAHSL